MKLVGLFAVLLSVLLAPHVVFATTYYVSAGGNDANSGLSPSAAWLSLQNAVNNTKVNPGDTIHIVAGTYALSQVLWLHQRGGTVGHLLTLEGEGNRTILNVANAFPGVSISMPYIALRNMVIENDSTGNNIEVWASNVSISNVETHHAYNSGLRVMAGTSNVVLDQINSHDNCQNNVNEQVFLSGSSNWNTGVNIMGSNHKIMNSTVWNNWCEGIGNGGTGNSNLTITNNTVHDNFSVHIYMDHVQYATIDGNYVYNSTTDTSHYRSGAPACGICVADENGGQGTATANLGDIIRNNVIVNAGEGIAYRTYGYILGLRQATIANNTIVNSTDHGIWIQRPDLATSTVMNNIIVGVYPHSLMNSDAQGYSGLIVKNNLWNPTGTSAAVAIGARSTISVVGTGDIYGTDPKFVACAANTQSASCYELQAGSPAIAHGITNTSLVPDDFSGTARPGTVSIGAWQYKAPGHAYTHRGIL